MDANPPAAAAEATGTIALKLMIDSRANKVIFAEAGKGMVDFLLGLLTLRVSSAVRLLNSTNGGGMPGCISRLYSTAASLSTQYMENPRVFEAAVLFPPASTGIVTSSYPRLLQDVESQVAAKEREEAASALRRSHAYICSGRYCSYASLYRGDECPDCHREMDIRLSLIGDGPGSGHISASRCPEPARDRDAFTGFVKDLEYMVTDDLRVLPSSAFSCMELLQGSGVKSVGDLEERVVTVGVDHGLALLKAAIESETVLTDVFLGKAATTQVEMDMDEETMAVSQNGKVAKMIRDRP